MPLTVPLTVPARLAVAAAACALAACAADAPPVVPWLYDAPLPLAPRPPTTGGFGRGVAPVVLAGAGITAARGAEVAGGPLSVEALLAAPADSAAAEAVAFGPTADGTALGLDLIDVDAGVVRWRETATGLAPYAITPTMVVVGDGGRLAGIDRARGGLRWQHAAVFRARDGELIAAGTARGIVLIDAATGELAAQLTPPAPAAAQAGDPPTDAAVVAVCATAAPHLYAWHRGVLSRWDTDAGDQLVQAWAVPTPQPTRFDGCGATVLLAGGGEVRALDPATGATVGGPIAARDYWMAREGDGVELATADGIERRDRRLEAPVRLEAAVVDRLVARRGARRLAVARDGSLVLFDERGARAVDAGFGAAQAALGDHYLLAGPWTQPARTQTPRVARWALPGLDAVAAPNPVLPRPLLGDPPHVDLPAPTPLPDGIARADAGAWAVGAAFVDPGDPERVYVGVLEASPTETSGGGLAAFDLHGDTWRWHARDACPPGTPVALAAAAEVVACGARGVTAGHGGVRAVSRRDGATVWEWRGETVDAVLAAGGAPGAGDVVVVVAGARVVVLDGGTGAERATWRTSDNYWPRLAVVRRGGDTIIASYEHGRVVLRSVVLGLRPLAALEVRGTLAALLAIGDRIAAELKDGSLYFLTDTGAAVAAGALDLGWAPAGDLAVATGVAGEPTRGGAGMTGLVVGVPADGVPRVFAALPGTGPLAVAGRGGAPGAPLVLTSGPTSRAYVLDAGGAPRAVLDLPPDAPRAPIVTTEVHGRPVVGVVLARPLRFIRVDVSEDTGD
ncbi:MAG TPA: hypothetical protein VM734_27545 [Kofleriaceae bacterium]|nr:hypothetical protein [Kofleriaceae bacterium]